MSVPFLENPLIHVPGRLATFKKWPHTNPNDKCVPQALAEAGFHHRPDLSEDSVQCFVCHKVLFGWSPHEDPMSEHKAHSPECVFVRLSEMHCGGYEKAPRRAVIEVECARFRAKFTDLFETRVKQRRELYEAKLLQLGKATHAFIKTNNIALPLSLVRPRNARKRAAC